MAAISEETLYTVSLTEQTLKELNIAIEKAKEENKPKIRSIEVKSYFSNVKFHINIGQCESLGYKLDNVEPVRKGKIIGDR